MKSLLPILLGAVALVALAAADQATLEKGQKEESLSCSPCHSLRLVHSQRLSKAAWNKELDKMAGWGCKMQDRDALMEYLMYYFGDDKPATPPVLSKDGIPRKGN
jgi:mono/diheme cytochrome c family protein